MMRKFLNSILTLIVFMFGSAVLAQTVDDVKEAIDAFEVALESRDLEELEKQYNRLGEYAEKKSALFADVIDRWNGLYARYEVVLAEAEENATLVADAGVTVEDVNQAISDLEAATAERNLDEMLRLDSLLDYYAYVDINLFTDIDRYMLVYNEFNQVRSDILDATLAAQDATLAAQDATLAAQRERINQLRSEIASYRETNRKLLVRREVKFLQSMRADLEENPDRDDWSEETKEWYNLAGVAENQTDEGHQMEAWYRSIYKK